MNKKGLIVSVMFLLLLSNATSAFAHPGRTDSNGGHTCRTNCEKWGLEYGEYHYHNGKGSSSSNKATNSSNRSSSGNGSGSSTKTTKPKESKPQYSQSSLKVYVNGKKIDFEHQPLKYKDSNLLPLRDLAKALDASFSYDSDRGKVVMAKDKFKVTLTLDAKTALYNGKTNTLSEAPKVINGTTYIPAQAVKGLGASIEYDSSDNILKIKI